MAIAARMPFVKMRKEEETAFAIRGSLAMASTVTEINECHSNPCDENADCVNLVNDYACSCKKGFVAGSVNSTRNFVQCYDVNECAHPKLSHCHPHAKCRNTIGSHDCECHEGFEGDGTTCIDTNECLGDAACPRNSVCKNTFGSYECFCEDGFEEGKESRRMNGSYPDNFCERGEVREE